MKELNAVDWIALTLVIIGGLNWGMTGIFGYNLMAGVFGQTTSLTRTIYALIGLSALYLVFTLPAFVRRSTENTALL